MSILKVGSSLDTITSNGLLTDLCFIILHSWPALISSFSSLWMGLHPVCYSLPSCASSFSPCCKRKEWMCKVVIYGTIQGSYNGENYPLRHFVITQGERGTFFLQIFSFLNSANNFFPHDCVVFARYNHIMHTLIVHSKTILVVTVLWLGGDYSFTY